MEIAIVVFDGFDTLDAIGPFEVFHHAQACGAELAVGLYTVDAQEFVSSSHGLRIVPDGTLDSGTDNGSGASKERSSTSPDIVVVPGGGWNVNAEQGVRGVVKRGRLPSILTNLHAAGSTMASVCTGAMVLAEAEIATNRPAVTHSRALDDLRAMGAEVIEARVVDDGDLVTAGGITAGIDLALYLLSREIGADVAECVATTMEYEPTGEIHIESSIEEH